MKKKYTLFLICFLALNLASSLAAGSTRVVVAQDGSGDFTSIQEAINTCRAFQTEEKVIYIKEGIYREKILIDSFFTHLHLIGESRENTIITFGDHANMEGIGTFNSYTLKVMGDFTTLENLTIRNDAGPVGQAVALHVEGDGIRVKNCNLEGDQDTLYTGGQKSRQYYTHCYISGTTDFIFGAATAVFDYCTLHSKKNSYITAASTPQHNKFGYVFRYCSLTAEPDVDKVYLGRPWRDYAQVVFIQCDMGAHIRPEGWHNWGKPEREKTTFYAEYNSQGEGGQPAGRVSWSHQISKKQAKKYTMDRIFAFRSEWKVVPATADN